MAGSRKPGPIGRITSIITETATDLALVPLRILTGDWDCGPDTKHKSRPGSLGVCPPWIKHLYLKKVTDIFVFNMFVDDDLRNFEALVRGTMPPRDDGQYHEEDVGYWAGVNVVFVPYESDARKAKAAFKAKLGVDGAIVIYLGHDTLRPPAAGEKYLGHSYGMLPDPTRNHEPAYPVKELRADLQKSPAALVILAGCDSKSLQTGGVNGASKGPVVISTDSGVDNLSWDTDMANAIVAFLLTIRGLESGQVGHWATRRVGGYGSIREALAAANRWFEAAKKEDRFVLSSGDAFVQLFHD